MDTVAFVNGHPPSTIHLAKFLRKRYAPIALAENAAVCGFSCTAVNTSSV